LADAAVQPVYAAGLHTLSLAHATLASLQVPPAQHAAPTAPQVATPPLGKQMLINMPLRFACAQLVPMAQSALVEHFAKHWPWVPAGADAGAIHRPLFAPVLGHCASPLQLIVQKLPGVIPTATSALD
jgi:hypothetical protein